MKVMDQKRLDAIHKLPCMACVQEGVFQPNRTTAHHVVSQSYRRLSGGHSSTIPLCEHHHLGTPLPDMSKSEMAMVYGPSLALNKRAFTAKYGSERELLERINAVINS
jgi:hypothetical protein